MRRQLQIDFLDERIVPTFDGNQVFPLDNPWNQIISAAPVAANSDAIISRIVNRHSSTLKLHADWGNPATDGALWGIPINVVDSSVPKVSVTIAPDGWADESDLVQVPIPANAVIEGDGPNGPSDPSDPSARGDSHLLVYDKTANVLYELGSAARPNEASYPYGGSKPIGVWGAYQISYWDLNQNSFRTIGATSADAAGLPIMPGLVRPDEALPTSAGGQGVIDHAIRVTMQQTRNSFVFPGSHYASSLTSSDLPRMGERFRLKSSFVIPSNWSPEAQAIAQAMKTYGLIVADNGSDFFFQGEPSDQWNMSNVLQVQQIPASNFEVVDLTPAVTGLNVTAGSTSGGTSVKITGRNFSGAAGQLHVLFGNTEATSVTILSDTQVIAVSPAHAAGIVDIRVQSGTNRQNTDGQSVFFGYGTSPITAADQFNFGGTRGGTPTANPDSYSIGHDHTLTLKTPGVLANDTSSPAGDVLAASLQTGPAHGTLKLYSNGAFIYRPAKGYTGSDSFAYVAKDGGSTSDPATVTLNVLASPQVQSMVINDGSTQRSLIRSITATFDMPVSLDPGAFLVIRSNGSIPTLTQDVTNTNGQTIVKLTFSGARTELGSLADGHWTLRVRHGRVHRVDDRATILSADSVLHFHRYFGDSDGNRNVDGTDQIAFDNAFGQTDALSLARFDFDNNGIVDSGDRAQFSKRFGHHI